MESQEEEDKEIPIPSHPSHSHTSLSHHTEHSSDDLRTGVFRYIQGSSMLLLSIARKREIYLLSFIIYIYYLYTNLYVCTIKWGQDYVKHYMTITI